MTQERESVIEKIAKLLGTQGRTPEEAAGFVNKANELAEKYGIAMYEVTGRKARMASDVKQTGAEDIFEHGKPQAWRWTVLEAAAEAAGVHVVKGWRSEENPKAKSWRKRYRQIVTAYFIGLPMDVEVAGYTYQYLVQEVERQSKEFARPTWDLIRQIAEERGIKVHEAEMMYVSDDGPYWGTHPLAQQASFRKGAAYGVKEALERLTAERQAAEAGTMALVVDRKAAIRDFIYLRDYGKTYDQFHADLRARQAEYAKNLPARPAPKPKRWTKTDQKRHEASMRRIARSEEAKQNRYWRGVDTASWSAGRTAGRAIRVNPAVEGGSE